MVTGRTRHVWLWLNVDEPDPECDLDYAPETGRRLKIEHAVANCIAFGSKNSALVPRKI